MSKKQIQNVRPRTALIIPKEEFKLQLIEQISQGKQFPLKNIVNEQQLSEVEKKFDLWDDYNTELLKSSFNNSINEYMSAYSNSGSMIGVSDVMRGISIHNPQHRFRTLNE